MHNHETDAENEDTSMSKLHMLVMALCCILPMVILIAVFAVFQGSPYLSFLIILICPLSMLLMHLPRMLPRKKKTEEHNHKAEQIENVN
jgi:L-asparagine transporter-like permease